MISHSSLGGRCLFSSLGESHLLWFAPQLLRDVALLKPEVMLPIKCMFEFPCPDLTRSFLRLIFPWRIACCYVFVCVVSSSSVLESIFVRGITPLCHQRFFLAQPQRFLGGSNVTVLSPLFSVPSMSSCCVRHGNPWFKHWCLLLIS